MPSRASPRAMASARRSSSSTTSTFITVVIGSAARRWLPVRRPGLRGKPGHEARRERRREGQNGGGGGPRGRFGGDVGEKGREPETGDGGDEPVTSVEDRFWPRHPGGVDHQPVVGRGGGGDLLALLSRLHEQHRALVMITE